MKELIFSLLFLYTINIHATDISCVLKKSATAALNEKGNVEVRTSSNDSIVVNISGIGNNEAIFNREYKIQLLKNDGEAYYYIQETSIGIILWTYFIKSNCLTYVKIRPFPTTLFPDSYLMIAKCKIMKE